ncbi:LysR family transcriptional regulator [Terrimonas sp. NA20]|uniref:LysR family transcriptional regulator n=1 Tax=Terrimonas ginsenosidimutans TaxID=2908004 RepID=A0ABS9KM16_9BACT|nr:LysR family transcriptional regulator [Terrimonas ginsenosidimutans]MCG2613320.1 LysR family transcriptional regulator [Terrimonas ginsenosidimutans]
MLKNAKFGFIDAETASIPDMTTQQIGYFLQLSEELHYWRTSYKMNATQSVISRQIKSLEEELQVQLFVRSNRKVELTPAGKFLQQQWKPLFERVHSAARYARKIHQGEGGSVIINHPGSISFDILPVLLSRIASLYSDVKVELIQIKHSLEIEMLRSYEVDLCYSRHLYEDDLITSTLIRQDHLALVVPEAHPITRKAEISSRTLQNERFILSTLTDGEAYQLKIDEIFATYAIKPNIRFESDFGSVILSLVAKKLGISIMPFSYSQAKPPGVRFIKLPFEVPLYLLWRKDEENAVIRNVLDLII